MLRFVLMYSASLNQHVWSAAVASKWGGSRHHQATLFAHRLSLPGLRGCLRGGGGSQASENRRLRRAAAGVTVASGKSPALPSRDSVALSKGILGAIDEEALCALILRRHLDFDAANTATAYRILLLRQYLHRSLVAAGRGNPLPWRRFCSSQPRRASAHALESCTALLQEAAMSKMRSWETRESLGVLHALARSKLKRSAVVVDVILPALASRIAAKSSVAAIHSWSPQDIANTLWSFAALINLNFQNILNFRELVAALTARALVVRDDFTPKDIGNMFWALATMGLAPGREFVVELMKRAQQVQDDFKHQASANMVWALRTLGEECDSELLQRLQEKAVLARNDGDMCLS